MADEKRVSLKIDLQKGVIELDAPADGFDQAVSKTMELASSLDFSPASADAVARADISPEVESSKSETPQAAAPATAKTRVRSPGGSAGRTGRIGSFEEVKALLSEPQERELRSFFTEKAPSEQSHKVLVAIVKGEELLERRGFSYNEIYTLMRLGGIKPLPKAIDVVLSRMAQDQFVTREGAGFAAKFLGREFVEGMPLKSEKGS
jgi:hypothetical protein